MFSYMWVSTDTARDSERMTPAEKGASPAKYPVEIEKPEVSDAENGDDDGAVGEEYMEEDNVYVKKAASEDSVTIVFAGDILFDANYAIMVSLQQRGGELTSSIAPEVLEEMKSADIMMVNNEFPYSDRGEPTPDKQYTFRAKPSTVSYLNEMGVDIVSLANNHAYDYGEEAFLDTLKVLEEAGIHYVGAGVDANEAESPVYYIVNGMKIAILSATQIERNDTPDTKEATETTPGVFRCWNGAGLIRKVQEAKEDSDFVIVYVHWGTENQPETDWAQEKQAVELVEAGADLIVGDHPHMLQRIEVRKGVPIIYSLGNFWFNSRTIDTGMLKVTLSENGLQSCQFIPCIQENCRTTLLEGEEKARVLEMLRGLSEGVGIDGDGYISF